MRSSSATRPIQVMIGYGWSEHEEKNHGLNPHWDFLRTTVKNAAMEVEKRGKKRERAPVSLRISIGRLRARHGAFVFEELLERIRTSDILVFDISNSNPNVIFELGCALATKSIAERSVYIFSSSRTQIPSDLRGFMLTKYLELPLKGKKQPAYALEDSRGFQASMRAALISIATERGMWGASRTVIEEGEEQIVKS